MNSCAHSRRFAGFLSAAWLAFSCASPLLLSGCWDGEGDGGERASGAVNGSKAAGAPPVAAWQAMVRVEEELHALAPQLSALARSLENLKLPDPRVRRFLDTVVNTTDLAPAASAVDAGGSMGSVVSNAPATRFRHWPIEAEDLPLAPSGDPVAAPALELWRPLFERVAYFEHAKFGVREASFEDSGHEGLRTLLKLNASARLRTGEIASIRGEVVALWNRRKGASVNPWRLAGWHTRSLHLQRAPGKLFREVLDRVLISPQEVVRARRSRHQEFVERRIAEPELFEAPNPHFFQGSQDRHPGIAVADVDGNGFDDLYVMARYGPNKLYLNDGRGGFEERASDFGLDLADHSSAAIFADFDDDGDPDLFLGRTLAPSRYFENRLADAEARFVDRSTPELPSLVSSISAIDLEGDGLLDLYVSTYAAQMVVVERTAQVRSAREGQPFEPLLLGRYLPRGDAEQLFELARHSEAHLYRNLPGPPNVVLRNRGAGRFEALEGESPLRSFHHTYQATWADYDNDGDPDVYLAHDFAPNQLLRNRGDGRFEDVTEATGTADIGFGMGASWGDYDGDGREDLYVSNMYSKAGRRITAHFDALDPRFAKMSRGNTLFRNTQQGFERVSGLEPPAMQVEAAGWAWGGQWADFSNDGLLDLFVLSGYYSAPEFVQSDVDI